MNTIKLLLVGITAVALSTAAMAQGGPDRGGGKPGPAAGGPGKSGKAAGPARRAGPGGGAARQAGPGPGARGAGRAGPPGRQAGPAVRRPPASRPAAAPAQRRPAGPAAARNNGPRRDGARNAGPQRGNARGPAPVADRQQLRARFSGGRYKRATNLNISIRVGTAVPRNRVTFYTVTPDIIRYYPRYRGYKFFLIDDEIIIVNPRTFEIVEIIEL